MTEAAATADTCDITVDEVFPHAPQTIWKTLTTPALMGRWIMTPDGFEPVVGNRFTFRTTPGGSWDGVIHCEVLEVIPYERFVYAWRGGHPDNEGYGAPLDTVVTFTLTRVTEGTRVHMVHSGFILPKNESAFRNMSGGWTRVVHALGTIGSEED
jgi:uncharacterized protein YndB with AHSA1/START domain